MGTFLPFRVYNTDNQLIIHSMNVIVFPPKSNPTSFNVLAKMFFNHDNNRFQAQKARKHIEEIP